MTNTPEHFCILPWINQEARTDGSVAVCCVMQETVPDFNLADGGTLKDAWESKWLADLRTDFLAGEKPKACFNCWNEEDAGIESKRLRELIKFSHHIEDLNHIKPKSMDLKLGNICNTKCRICTSFASSQWVPEEIERDASTNLFAQMMARNGRWPEMNEEFWEDLESQIEEVESLEFFGGEPFLIKRHFDILQSLVDKGRAKDISISYNTNGSIYPAHAIDLWEQFKKVQIFFSIDGVGKHFDYIRHPQQFDAIIDNFHKFNQHDFLDVNIFYTVGLFNVMYMDEILTWQLDNNIDCNIHFNMVYEPKHVSPKALPKSVKRAITEKLGGHSDPRIQTTLNYMNQEHYLGHMDEFVRQTSFSDKYRDESIAETFPELWEHLKPFFEQSDTMKFVSEMQYIKAGNKHDGL